MPPRLCRFSESRDPGHQAKYERSFSPPAGWSEKVEKKRGQGQDDGPAGENVDLVTLHAFQNGRHVDLPRV